MTFNKNPVSTISPGQKVSLEISRIAEAMKKYMDEHKKMFVTSSFQTHSIPLLHIMKTIKPDIDVFFLDTGFHFPETYLFRDQVKDLLELNLRNIESPVPKLGQRNEKGHFHYMSDPDHCCYLNKTLPTESLLKEYDIWINGIRRDQNGYRKQIRTEEKANFNSLRYHPMLEWNSRMVWLYARQHDLPAHPLDKEGFMSIGCRPCTEKPDPGELHSGRSARWKGLSKTECGLHTDLIVR